MPRRPPPSSCRGNLVLATLLAITLLFFCSTDAQGRPGGPHDRRREEQQQRWSDENAPRVLAASDDAAAAPSPSAPPTLALLLAPTPAPSRVAAAAVAASESLLLREGGVKGAAAAAPSPSAISDGDDDGDDDDNEEEEEASSGDGAGQEAAGSEEEADPEAQAGVAADVASAASEPPAAPVQPKRVRFLARGASKAIDQSEVDPSSLSGEKGSFVFYGRYCGPGARFVFFFVEGREGGVLVSERKVRSLPSRGSKGERKGGGGRKVRVETKKGVESDTFLFFSLCNLSL